jgi:hypothetical protein
MTNTSFTSWSNQGTCKIDDLQLQNRSKIQYDTNYCGEIANTTIWDYQNISCNYCSYNLTNTSKSSWINETCVSIQMNQSRSWVEYDTNKSICYDVTGLPSDYYANLTYYEYQLVGPIYSNTTGAWTNLSCISNNTMNQTRDIIQSDLYTCAANTTFTEYRQSEYCLYSNPINKIIFRNYQSNDPRNQFCFIFYVGAPELCINETILTKILIDYG